MKIQTAITEKLNAAFNPTHLQVVNESHMHSVPKNSETHFLVIVVTEAFANLSRVQRAQKVHETLAHELKNGVHALSTRLWTPEEWVEKGQKNTIQSPNCASKRQTQL